MSNNPTITFKLTSAGVLGEPSYVDLNITVSNSFAYPLGLVDGWCADLDTNIGVPHTYTATIYSSYEYDILRANPDFATVGNVGAPLLPSVSVPYDGSHPAQPYLANLDIVNWLLGNVQVSADPTTARIKVGNSLSERYRSLLPCYRTQRGLHLR